MRPADQTDQAQTADQEVQPPAEAVDPWEAWDRRSAGGSQRSRWSARDWRKWQEGRWTWRGQDDASSESSSDSEILHDEEVVPEEVLGWLLLRKSGLPSTARLAVQSAIQGDLTFDKVERTLRDQEEELLSDERYGRAGGKGHRPHHKRTYRVEVGGVWGVLRDDSMEDFSDDLVLWCQGDL